MSFRSHLPVALLAVASLFVAACQPAVSVARATAGLPQTGPAPREAPVVPVHPSAIEGRKIFEQADRCVICHGREGLGNGPAAANLTSSGRNVMTDFFRLIGIRIQGEKLPSRPANFHNTVAMRLNSPFSMYETVTRGRPNTAMPAFPRPENYPKQGDKPGKPGYGANLGGRLTDEQRWHVIFHEWTFATTPEEVARGKELYETKAVDIGGSALTCAACHGTGGDGRGPQGMELAKELWGWARGQGPGIFTDINLMAQRKPTELFQGIMDGRGKMPSYRGKLPEDEVWALVNYIYTFIYVYGR